MGQKSPPADRVIVLSSSPFIVRRSAAPVAPPVLVPRRRATVNFTSLGAANPEEQRWVIGGDTGLHLTTTDEQTGHSRLIAVYVAFMVESCAVDNTEPDRVIISGKVRWHGVPGDRDDVWREKLTAPGPEQRQLVVALERCFGFVEARIDMAPCFLAGPATTAEVATCHGYQCFLGTGKPAVKFFVNMGATQSGARRAMDFYRAAQGLSALSLRRWWWRWTNSAREELYKLGWRYAVEGLPTVQVNDGLDADRRAVLMKEVATAAAGPMVSCARLAWCGDPKVYAALQKHNLAPLNFATDGDEYGR